MKKLASLVLLVPVAAALSASCVADATDEAVDDAVEPGVRWGKGNPAPELDPVSAAHAWLANHPGRCADACYDVAIDLCDWQEACEDGSPTDVVVCADKALSCDAAQHAANGETWGLSSCWRDCEELAN